MTLTCTVRLQPSRRAVSSNDPQSGRTNKHYWDGEVLGKHGWIAIYGPRERQEASAALVALEASHPVRPRFFDAHVDTIELHILDPRRPRALGEGRVFHLEYLLLVSPETDNWHWIDSLVEETHAVLPALFEVIEDRYDRASTLITSQVPVKNWHEVIGEPTLADAILDRLVHNAYKINLKGDSMRKKKTSLTTESGTAT